MPSLQLLAPAKLNLLLRIIGRRDDGYHRLQTVFQLLDFGDLLHFELLDNSAITVDCGDLQIPLQQNLIYRAAFMLQQFSDCHRGVHIQLQKNLPLGGGIGGGSSDAATTLLGLNKLWNCGLSVDQLAELGCQLGADVPVFVRGNTAWAEGIGELLTPVATEQQYYVVLTPDCHVSTTALFADSRLTRDSAPITLALLRDRELTRDWLEQYAGNDFQPLVESLYPQVQQARVWLEQFAKAQLTGSGACVFASFESASEAQLVLAKVPEGLSGFVAAGVNVSPAHKQLAELSV